MPCYSSPRKVNKVFLMLLLVSHKPPELGLQGTPWSSPPPCPPILAKRTDSMLFSSLLPLGGAAVSDVPSCLCTWRTHKSSHHGTTVTQISDNEVTQIAPFTCPSPPSLSQLPGVTIPTSGLSCKELWFEWETYILSHKGSGHLKDWKWDRSNSWKWQWKLRDIFQASEIESRQRRYDGSRGRKVPFFLFLARWVHPKMS